MGNIFSNGIELTDAELDALSIDVRCVWLDMWKEARDQDAYALRQAEEGYDPVWVPAADEYTKAVTQ